MDEIVIHFSPEGVAHCLWTDGIDLLELGEVHTKRATDIEFNDSRQHWEIRTAAGELMAAGFRKRELAIDYERRLLHYKMISTA